MHQLTTVKDLAGETVVVPIGLDPDFSEPVTLLIHGYNAESDEAAASYEDLLHTMKWRSLMPPFLERQSCLFFWQGYTSGGGATGKTRFSPLSYHKQIPSACDAAIALKRYLDKKIAKYGPVTVNLIAHSLGCRLMLELLESYAQTPAHCAIRFPVAVLLAAAVPSGFVENRERLSQGARLPDRAAVLFSNKDSILTFWFRIGQTRAKEGTLPTAVGATGNPAILRPAGVWTARTATENKHSGYFTDFVTAREIARVFGLPIPKSLPSFAGLTPVTNYGVFSRELPSSYLPVSTTTRKRV